MHLYVEPMDAVVVEVSDDGGRVRFEDGECAAPTLQERRAIIYAAENAIAELREASDRLAALGTSAAGGRPGNPQPSRGPESR